MNPVKDEDRARLREEKLNVKVTLYYDGDKQIGRHLNSAFKENEDSPEV